MRLQRVRSLLLETGSTRSMALLRIGLAAVAWAKFGRQLGLWRGDFSADRLLITAVYFPASVTLLLGWRARTSALLCGGAMLWAYFALGVLGTNDKLDHHHTYLLAVCVTLLASVPCGGSFSVDRWLAVRRAARDGGAPPQETGALWGRRLIQWQFANLFWWAGFQKAGVRFPERMEAIAMSRYLGSDAPTWSGFSEAMFVLGWGVVWLEFAAPVLLWIPATRALGAAAVFVLMAGFYVALPVSTFPATVLVLVLVFSDPAAVHRVVDQLVSPPGSPAAHST